MAFLRMGLAFTGGHVGIEGRGSLGSLGCRVRGLGARGSAAEYRVWIRESYADLGGG